MCEECKMEIKSDAYLWFSNHERFHVQFQCIDQNRFPIKKTKILVDKRLKNQNDLQQLLGIGFLFEVKILTIRLL